MDIQYLFKYLFGVLFYHISDSIIFIAWYSSIYRIINFQYERLSSSKFLNFFRNVYKGVAKPQNGLPMGWKSGKIKRGGEMENSQMIGRRLGRTGWWRWRTLDGLCLWGPPRRSDRRFRCLLVIIEAAWWPGLLPAAWCMLPGRINNPPHNQALPLGLCPSL